MTIRELKDLINGVEEKDLDKEIHCYIETLGGGDKIYKNTPFFDKYWTMYSLSEEYAITFCPTKDDFECHEELYNWDEDLNEDIYTWSALDES